MFASDGKMERDMDMVGAAAAVLQYWTVVGKVVELSQKAKLSIFQSLYVSTLTNGHELWVMPKKRNCG